MSEAEPKATPMREPGKRLFVGAKVSIATANALSAAAETLARRARDARIEVKWVPSINYHLTLKFLGWTRESAVGAVADALEVAARGTPRLTFRTARLGGFPSLDKAHVLWAGVQESGGEAGAIPPLIRRIDAAMAALGYQAEARAFHAHVTLGRLRDARPIRELVLPLAEQMFGDTRIDSISLFESLTKPSGSVYSELARIEFNPAPADAERQTREVHLAARDPHSDPRGDDDTDDGWPRGQGPNH